MPMASSHHSSPSTSDRDIVLAAVNEDGAALEHAFDELKSNREIVLAAAVNQNVSTSVCFF
jgi:hypothetical protein